MSFLNSIKDFFMPPEIEEDENSGQEGTAQENSSRESHEEKRNKVVNIQATAQLQVVFQLKV